MSWKMRRSFCNTPAASGEGIPGSLQVYETDCQEKELPFTNAGLLDSEEDLLQDLILRFKTSLPIQYRSSADRLFTLLDYSKDEDPSGPGIVLDSLQTFYDFLESHANLKLPMVSLTPENNIYASWRDEKKRVFSLDVLPNGVVHFVSFEPNDKHPDQQIRLYGTATIDVLKETAIPNAVWDWITE